MKKCPQCGLTYDDDTLFYCLNDGTDLSEAFDPTEAETVYKKPLPPFAAPLAGKLNKKLIYVILILGAAVSAAVILWLVYQSSDSRSQRCVLYNDEPKENSVITRSNCDRASCDDDSNTIIGAQANGTEIERLKTTAIKSRYKKFNWVQVVIQNQYKPTVWVADTKIKCTSQ